MGSSLGLTLANVFMSHLEAIFVGKRFNPFEVNCL